VRLLVSSEQERVDVLTKVHMLITGVYSASTRSSVELLENSEAQVQSVKACLVIV